MAGSRQSQPCSLCSKLVEEPDWTPQLAKLLQFHHNNNVAAAAVTRLA